MSARRTVHLPIRVRVTGVPDAQALDRLTDAVARLVTAAMLTAGREVARAHQASTMDPDRGLRERHDPDREQDNDYALPSYGGGGKPVAVPIAPHRPWVVLRSVDFRATVGDFLDAVERQREEPLENRVLYTDLADEERWVECWWVRTNDSIDLAALNTMLAERAGQLARVGPKQVLATMISPFDAAWLELANLDSTGAVRRLPPPGERNAHRVDGNGHDAHLRHGAWVYFAFMVLPAIVAADYLRIGTPNPVELDLTAAGLLVDERAFAHHFGVAWGRYAEEFATDLVQVDALPLTVIKPIAAAAAFYLAAGALPEVIVTGLAGQRFLVLTAGVLGQLPDPLRRAAGSVSGHPAPDGAIAVPSARLLSGWPLLYLRADLPLTPDRVALAKMGPTARELAGRIRAMLAQDPGELHWWHPMLSLLDGELGEAPDQRPPGGTLFEYVLRELDRSGDFLALFNAVDQAHHFGTRLALLRYSLPTVYGSHPRVVALMQALSRARLDSMRNSYITDGDGAILLDRKYAVLAGEVFGDVDSTYIFSSKLRQLKPAKAAALRDALLAERISLMAVVTTGSVTADYDTEAFAKESLARAVKLVGIGEDDFTKVKVERSMKLVRVERRDIDSLPSFHISYAFVDRIDGGAWAQTGQVWEKESGDFEAKLIEWALVRAGEFYQAMLLGIVIVGGIAFAIEAGLVAALVDLAGGATAVAVSITISEVIYLIRVALGNAELTLGGFLMAALDGYLALLGFKLGALVGRWVAVRIGTATVRRVVAGWIAERLLVGVVGGAASSAIELFAHDLINLATGDGGWSGAGKYIRAMGLGALVGVLAEFTVQPALHAMAAGGRSALTSVAELVARVKADGFGAVGFSTALADSLSSLRSALGELIGGAAARDVVAAMAERLGDAVNKLGGSFVARRVLELSGAKFSRAAIEGLDRFLVAAEAAGSPAKALEVTTVFAAHPQETVHFLEALSKMTPDAARDLANGTFGSHQELAAFLGRLAGYPPGAQREIVRMLGELKIQVAPPIALRTTEELLQQQLAASLRIQGEGLGEQAARLQAEAAAQRGRAVQADAAGTRGAAGMRKRAEQLEAQAQSLLDRRAESLALADQLQPGAPPAASPAGRPSDVVPTDAEIDDEFARLEAGTSSGGPQAWIRLSGEKMRAHPGDLARLVRPIFSSRTGNRVVFRVQGGTGVESSKELVHVDPSSGAVRLDASVMPRVTVNARGATQFAGGDSLNLNFGVFERAVAFLLQNRPGGRLVAFEVDEGWFQSLRSAASPERGTAAAVVDRTTGKAIAGRGGAPTIKDVDNVARTVDIRFGEDQLQLPPSLIPELNEFIIPGSGRVVEIGP